MTDVDVAALRERYRIEREKRLRPDGPSQYQRLTRRFSADRYDPYLPVVPRDPVTDDVTVAVVGAGFAGMLTVSAPTGDQLSEACGRLEQAAAQAQCDLRLLRGQQAQAFAAAELPLTRGL